MSPTGVSLRRRLPSPENDTSFFPSESLHDGKDLKRNVPSCESVSTSTCTSPSLVERLKDEASYNETNEDASSCLDESDSSESESSVESVEDEDDESTLRENLIGRKILVCPMLDDDDDSSLGSLGDDQSLKEDDEKLMSEDDDDSFSSSEDEPTHGPEEVSDTEKVSRIPRSFIVGKKYYGTKQPRSFDSDEMSHDCNSSVYSNSNSSSSSSSEEGARGLGLALDDALSALSEVSYDKEQTENELSGAEEDEVSSVFESDDEDTVSEHYGANNKILQTYQSEMTQSNNNAFVSMEDELKQALIENGEGEESIDDNNIGIILAREREDGSRIVGRKDSISIEDLEEIINESSSSESEIDFSDDEDVGETNLTKDKKIESQHSKIKRNLSEGRFSLNYLNQDSSTSLKRFRSSSESSSSSGNEEDISRQQLLITDSTLPPLPWLSLGPSQSSKEVISSNQSSNMPPLSPQGEIYEKEYQDEENQIEFELSEELDYSNKLKAPNEYFAVDTVPLL